LLVLQPAGKSLIDNTAALAADWAAAVGKGVPLAEGDSLAVDRLFDV
jgi:hypothetical protein